LDDYSVDYLIMVNGDEVVDYFRWTCAQK